MLLINYIFCCSRLLKKSFILTMNFDSIKDEIKRNKEQQLGATIHIPDGKAFDNVRRRLDVSIDRKIQEQLFKRIVGLRKTKQISLEEAIQFNKTLKHINDMDATDFICKVEFRHRDFILKKLEDARNAKYAGEMAKNISLGAAIDRKQIKNSLKQRNLRERAKVNKDKIIDSSFEQQLQIRSEGQCQVFDRSSSVIKEMSFTDFKNKRYKLLKSANSSFDQTKNHAEQEKPLNTTIDGKQHEKYNKKITFLPEVWFTMSDAQKEVNEPSKLNHGNNIIDKKIVFGQPHELKQIDRIVKLEEDRVKNMDLRESSSDESIPINEDEEEQLQQKSFLEHLKVVNKNRAASVTLREQFSFVHNIKPATDIPSATPLANEDNEQSSTLSEGPSCMLRSDIIEYDRINEDDKKDSPPWPKYQNSRSTHDEEKIPSSGSRDCVTAPLINRRNKTTSRGIHPISSPILNYSSDSRVPGKIPRNIPSKLKHKALKSNIETLSIKTDSSHQIFSLLQPPNHAPVRFYLDDQKSSNQYIRSATYTSKIGEKHLSYNRHGESSCSQPQQIETTLNTTKISSKILNRSYNTCPGSPNPNEDSSTNTDKKPQKSASPSKEDFRKRILEDRKTRAQLRDKLWNLSGMKSSKLRNFNATVLGSKEVSGSLTKNSFQEFMTKANALGDEARENLNNLKFEKFKTDFRLNSQVETHKTLRDLDNTRGKTLEIMYLYKKSEKLDHKEQCSEIVQQAKLRSVRVERIVSSINRKSLLTELKMTRLRRAQLGSEL